MRNNKIGFLVALVTLLTLLIIACGQQNEPMSNISGAPIASLTTLAPLIPTATPKWESAIIITPQSELVDSEARLILTIIIEDEKGALMNSDIAIHWLDGHAPLELGTTSDIEVPIRARFSPFVVVVSNHGYETVRQPFEISLSEEMVYELVVKLKYVGESA